MVHEPFKGYFSGRNFAKHLTEWLPWKLRELGLSKLLDNGPVVDLGCGLATTLEELARAYPNVQVISVDINSEYLADAKARIPANASLIKTFLKELPIRNGSIPIAISHKIYQLENEKTYSQIAKEIHRILKAGGVYFSLEDMKKYMEPFKRLGLIPVQDEYYAILMKP